MLADLAKYDDVNDGEIAPGGNEHCLLLDKFNFIGSGPGPLIKALAVVKFSLRAFRDGEDVQ